jgi:peptide-methionine (S)-S-oxide reductase
MEVNKIMNKKLFFKLINSIGFSFIFMVLLTFNVFAETGTKREVATLGGGCFWSMEAIYQRLNGVISAQPGYSGGITKNPTYEQVVSGKTGHAEAIQITFDPNKISYQKILEVFFTVLDPTTLNRQGADEGTNYRSVVFYHNKQQKEVAEKAKKDILKSGLWGKSVVVTELIPFIKFYPAESYHKNYYNTHTTQGYCVAVIDPKLNKLKSHFRNLLK